MHHVMETPSGINITKTGKFRISKNIAWRLKTNIFKLISLSTNQIGLFRVGQSEVEFVTSI